MTEDAEGLRIVLICCLVVAVGALVFACARE
jgi:hypothetical protein